MPDRNPFTALLRCATALLVVAAAAQPAFPADPFYENLLAEGRTALARGEIESALLELEIACFGLLEEPPLLADGLVHLALAQAAAGQVRELDTTLGRLLEVESRFAGYRQADIPAETRQRFEELLLERIPLPRLRRIEVFRPLAQQRQMEALRAMPPAERRTALERRLAEEPADFQALQMLAELELAEGNPRLALGHLERLIELGGEDPLLVCRRFRAAALAGECAVALSDLPVCTAEAEDVAVAQPVLECLAAGEDLEPAFDFLASLPPAVARNSKIRKLEQQLERRRKQEQRSASRQSEPATEETTDAASPAQAEVGGAEESGGVAPPASPEPGVEVPAGEPAEELIDPCEEFRRDALGNRCDEALALLDSCQSTIERPLVAERVARCLSDASRWSDLRAFVAALPPELQQLPELAELDRRAAERAPEAAEGTATEPTEESHDLRPSTQDPRPTTQDPRPTTQDPRPTTQDPTQLATLAARLAEARSTEALEQVLAEAVRLARQHPGSSAAQLLAAEAAYRAARWQEAVHFFDAAGDPGDDRPLLLFYRAVSLYEVGRVEAAAASLDRALPKLQRTPFVESYVARIRRAAGQ